MTHNFANKQKSSCFTFKFFKLITFLLNLLMNRLLHAHLLASGQLQSDLLIYQHH